MKAAKTDSATLEADSVPATVVQPEPQHGGSYVRDPDAGTITRTSPAPAYQPVQE